MLDYYGSIIKENDEIIKELQSYFKQNGDYSPKLIKDIVIDLKKRGLMESSYSQTGWWQFYAKSVCEIIKKELDHKTMKNKKKLAFMYSMENTSQAPFTDILEKIVFYI
tara:strand:- start:2434 stop:2760 length:327 start_codon:yes stop_codon:yes gene_type:complete